MAKSLLERIYGRVYTLLSSRPFSKPQRAVGFRFPLNLLVLGGLIVGVIVWLGQGGTPVLSSDDGSLLSTRSASSPTLALPANDRPEATIAPRQTASAPTAPRASTPASSLSSSISSPTPGTAAVFSRTPPALNTAIVAVPDGTAVSEPVSDTASPASALAAVPAPASLPDDLDLYPPDMQRLIRQGYFVVGIPSFDTPPFYFEKDGELQGS